MRKFFKALGLIFVALILIAVIGAAWLWVSTRGDHSVPATVMGDPNLPAREVLGVRLHAESFGDETAPLIVVLHGGPGGDYRSLLPLQALSEQGYRVLFYDQRGAGLSQRLPETELTLATHIAELNAIIAQDSPDQAVTLIGHSWGAMLASAFLGVHPEQVERAVLMEPGFLSAEGSDSFMAQMSDVIMTPSVLWGGLVAGFEAQHVDGPDDYASQDYLMGTMATRFAGESPYVCAGDGWDSPAWRMGADAADAVPGQASRADLDSLGAGRDFAGPVLFISGACNTFIGPDVQARHAAAFQNAQHVVIENAGHDMVNDQPDLTLAAIAAFLRPQP